MSDENENPPAENAEAAPEANDEKAPEAANEEDALVVKPDEEDPLHRHVKREDMCCCCICSCTVEETRNESCFGCFPIKCGVIAIGILTFFLAITSFTEVFFMLLNEHIHWWYVLVALLLLVPLILAVSFVIVFYNKDTESSRGKFRTALILVICSYTLLALWNITYFNAWYKKGDVLSGAPEIGYWKQTRKQFLFWSVFFSITIDAFYAYFICIIASYKTQMKKYEDRIAAEKAE